MGGTESPLGAKGRMSTQKTSCGEKRNGEHACPGSVGKKEELKVEGEERVTQKEEVRETV